MNTALTRQLLERSGERHSYGNGYDTSQLPPYYQYQLPASDANTTRALICHDGQYHSQFQPTTVFPKVPQLTIDSFKPNIHPLKGIPTQPNF